MTDTIYRSGAKAIDGTTTTATWEVPASLHGCLKVHAHDITSLTYTIQVSYDEGTTYLNVSGVTSEGVAVARGGTVTAIDNVDFLFPAFGVTNVKVTRTTGSGPVQLVEDRYGAEYQAARLIQIISGGSAATVNKVKQSTTITSSTAETTILTAGGAGVFNDVYKLIIANTSASACEVTIRDATGGSLIDPFMVPASDTRGFTVNPIGANPQTTANNNWTAQCGTSVASIKISVNAITRS